MTKIKKQEMEVHWSKAVTNGRIIDQQVSGNEKTQYLDRFKNLPAVAPIQTNGQNKGAGRGKGELSFSD